MNKILPIAFLIVLVAGSALAERPVVGSKYEDLGPMSEVVANDNRDTYVLTYDFSDGSILYDYNGVTFDSHGILPADAKIVGVGVTDLVIETFDNSGPMGPNYTNELIVGYTYWSTVDNAVRLTGGRPFMLDYMQGPGVFGPISGHWNVGSGSDQSNPPPASDFMFAALTFFPDQTGMYAGELLSGQVYVEIESSVVSTENTSWSTVKALFK